MERKEFKRRLWIILVGICVLIMGLVYCGYCEFSKEYLSSQRNLKDVDAITVLVIPGPDLIKKAGLDEEQIKSDVELRLRNHGIPVFNEAPNDKKIPVILEVWITAVTADESGLWLSAVTIEMKCREWALLPRPIRELYLVTTWNRTTTGLAGKDVLKTSIRDTIKDMADVLANDYLAANPKK